MKIKDLCFEVIQKCPNNCLFCSSKSNFDKCNIVDIETFKKTINYFTYLGGIEEISFSGGEPMLHPNIFDMVKYCSDLGIKTTLYTSGIVTRTDQPQSDNIYYSKILNQFNNFRDISIEEFSKLESYGLSKVVFDLQASEVDEYNELMGTKNNMPLLLKTILHASYFSFDKSIHFIPNKINVNQIKDVLELTELAGIKELRILKFVPQGRGQQNKNILQLSNDELLSFVKYVEQLTSDTTTIKIGIPLLSENKHICTAGYDKVVIRYDGQILPCPAFKDIDLKALEQKGFKSINIFDNLEDYKITKHFHNTPLCEQLNRHEEKQM